MIVRDHHLEVDLGPGVHGAEWEQLLDVVIAELAAVDRVTFLVPWGFKAGDQGEFLESLVRTLTVRGVDVERRHVG
jgi:hypothetical protein